MREIDVLPQRRQQTPFGQRNCSNAVRHSASVSKSTINFARVALAVSMGVLSVPRKSKPATQMTDNELVRKLFPKPVRKALKRVLLELNEETPKRRKPKKS